MTKVKCQNALFEVLLAEHVDCIFGNPGTTELGFYDSLQDYPQIKYYLGLHETVAMAMADGYARASGKTAVVNVHTEPGVANSLGMLLNIHAGHTPMVVTAGQQYTDLLMQDPLLSGDLVGMTRPFTKWSVEVGRPEDVPLVMRRAFKVAGTQPTGPVFVSLPMDVLAGEIDFSRNSIRRPLTTVFPDPSALAKAVELLCYSDHLVLLVGDGVAQSGGIQEAVHLAEILGARVYASPTKSEVCFPTSHPQYMGRLNLLNAETIAQSLGRTDVLLAVGACVLPVFLPTPTPFIPKHTKIIHMDCNVWEIGKNYSVALGIVTDPKEGMKGLVECLNSRMSKEAKKKFEDRKHTILEEKTAMKAATQAMLKSGWDNQPISLGRMMSEIRDSLSPGTVIVDQCSTSSPMLHAALDFDEPGTFFGIRGGTLGWGLPAALGVKLACPDRPVVAVVGDGEGMYSVQALWTAAHYRIPVTFVICGNASYEILKINMMRYLQGKGDSERQSRFIGMDLRDPVLDYAGMARAFGIWGCRVEAPADLRDTFKEALNQDGPAVVDVAIEGLMTLIERKGA